MEAYANRIHHRRSIRLKAYDYSQEGAYYVTICTHARVCVFGAVVGENVRLSRFGQMARNEWLRTPQIRPEAELDDFVVMPNHVHGIILLAPTVGAYRNTPLRDDPPQNHRLVSPSRTLGAIIRGFKSTTTLQINKLRNRPGSSLWQRNYYEHVIRDLDDLNRIREYIQNNPLPWSSDEDNPINIATSNFKSGVGEDESL